MKPFPEWYIDELLKPFKGNQRSTNLTYYKQTYRDGERHVIQFLHNKYDTALVADILFQFEENKGELAIRNPGNIYLQETRLQTHHFNFFKGEEIEASIHALQEEWRKKQKELKYTNSPKKP